MVNGLVGFWWGPLGSQVGDPPPEVGDGKGRCQKIGLCADLENVQLDLNHLKTGSGNWSFFGGTFGQFWVYLVSTGVIDG